MTTNILESEEFLKDVNFNSGIPYCNPFDGNIKLSEEHFSENTFKENKTYIYFVTIDSEGNFYSDSRSISRCTVSSPDNISVTDINEKSLIDKENYDRAMNFLR